MGAQGPEQSLNSSCTERGFSRWQEPKSGFHQLKGQVGREAARAKARWLGVGLACAWLGRKEGQGQISEGLECLGDGFCPASHGEPWLAPELGGDVAKVGQVIRRVIGLVLGETLQGPYGRGGGQGLAWGGSTDTVIPPEPRLPPLLAEGLFHSRAAPGRV